MEMTIIDRDEGVTYVVLAGALDLPGTNSIDLRFQSSVAPRRKPTIIDMAGVSFISSLGMGMLVAAASSLRRNGKKMVLLGPQAPVAEALRHARIDIVIPIADSMDRATAAILS